MADVWATPEPAATPPLKPANDPYAVLRNRDLVLYLIGVLLPVSRTAFLDVRYHLGVGSALFAAFVTIPVTTILVEEVAFRSVLWAVLSRHATTWRVLVTSSVLFGLWHILPSLHIATANHGIGDAICANSFGVFIADLDSRFDPHIHNKRIFF